MWIHGSVDIARAVRFELKTVKKNAIWHPKTSLYDSALKVNPYAFAYAATRTSIVGTHIGLRGSIAGGGLAIATTAYLNRDKSGLAFHHRFHNVKDFIGSGIKGTVGAAFSYLYMVDKGYKWAGHWEDVVPPPFGDAHPDFVFASNLRVCMVDAKGSSSNIAAVESLVKQEWKRQIWPNRKKVLSIGGTCTEGVVIATAIAVKKNANFIKAYSNFPSGAVTAASIAAVKSVQRGNYINACFLLGLSKTAFALMSGRRGNARPVDTLLDELKFYNANGDVFVGPPRLMLQASEKSYVMRPFANIGVLREIIGGLYSDQYSFNWDLPSPILNANDSGKEENFLILGPDGVGAKFTAVR